MVRKRIYPAPRFTSDKDEAAYWETHSPLLEGYEGKLETREGRRRSVLALRLSGRELDMLREAALREGVGPTTLARTLILRGLAARKPSAGVEERLAALEKKVRRLAAG